MCCMLPEQTSLWLRDGKKNTHNTYSICYSPKTILGAKTCMTNDAVNKTIKMCLLHVLFVLTACLVNPMVTVTAGIKVVIRSNLKGSLL